MDTIEFFNLHTTKQFKKFHCHHSTDEVGCNYEFYEKHVQGNLKDSKPDFNPLENAVFYDTKRQYEIYSLRLVLHISRGVLIKKDLYAFLMNYRLAEHCAFNEIKREFEGKIYDDLVFLYFYRDYSLTIDYSNSLYWLLRKGFDTRDRDKESMEDYVIEDNISLDSFNDWEEKQRELNKSDKTKSLQIKHVKCPSVVKYDMFGFQGFSAGIFISKKLREDLEKRKTKGLDFWGNIYFKFQG